MVDRARTGPENTSGLRSVLSLAPAYRAAQRLIGADQARRFLTEEILSLGTHDRLLDIGCGTADILEHLPAVDYVGFDPSRRYVAAARSWFGDRGKFVTSLAALGDPGLTDRSVVLAIGVLHHMDDDQAHETLDLALQALRPGGRFVSFDPAFVDGQHWFARFLITRDRGRHVRTPDETAALFHNRFQTVDIQLRHDLLRTPYSHVIVQAFALWSSSKQLSAAGEFPKEIVADIARSAFASPGKAVMPVIGPRRHVEGCPVSGGGSCGHTAIVGFTCAEFFSDRCSGIVRALDLTCGRNIPLWSCF